MKRWRSGLAAVVLLGLAAAAPAAEKPPAGPAPSPELPAEERLWIHRNLGKAFYENATTQYQAVDELKKALELAPGSVRERVNYGLALLKAGRVPDGIAELQKAQAQDPSVPHTWFNLGIAFKRDSRYEEAIAQLERMAALVPDEPVTRYNLGALYKLTGRPERSLVEFETAARLAPGLAGPHFQLYNAYRQAGRAEDAARELATFQAIKKRQEGAAVPEDLEWSWYSEIWDETDPVGVAAAPAPAKPVLEPTVVARGLDPATAGLAGLDADGDGRPDLVAWSAKGALLLAGGTKAVSPSGLEGLASVTAVAPGDFDNDGLADLAVATASGAALYRNEKGRFVKTGAALPAGRWAALLWVDVDHDYDVDLLLFGDKGALARNEGTAGFADETKRFPFAEGKAVAAAAFDLVADTQGVDVAVVYADRPAVLYRDRLGGTYEAEPLPGVGAGAASVSVFDLDHDGWTDLATDRGLSLNGKSLNGALAAPVALAAPPPYAFADLDNRGVADLVAGDGLHRNLGGGSFGPAEPLPGFPAVAVEAADFDGDRRTDLAAVGKDGALTLLRNRAETGHRALVISLTGVKNLALAPGAEVEVKAGPSYQKLTYRGLPLVVGLGRRAQADTVRITWPNGLIQNEPRQAAGEAQTYKEAPRLSGSCPMIFTWDGERFRFITDVLGVAPLGASAGDGQYFPVDHDEYVQIPGDALAAVDGVYEIRVTEELREVAYLDRMQLIAVDHPAGVEIFTNDKFKGPPFPEFRLFGVEHRIPPVAARDHRGKNVRERLLARDRTYADGFARDYAGVAERHRLDLDFGDAAPDGRAILVLSGWVDWADGSTFLGAAQASPEGLVMPSIQVRDEAGEWVTVVEDMGIPAGKPKTVVVDLSGKWLSRSREVRIETNLCVYWDEVFLAEMAEMEGGPETVLTPLDPAGASLRFRGFSRPIVHPERKQPEAFDYHDWMPVSGWNPTPGRYTRYGEVAELLSAIDDRMVVMGSGDEVRLLFDATALPPLPSGWTRDFLLFVDGWAKDGDANTAFGQSVEPLPFHGMSQYPYGADERFPDGPVHKVWREHWLTRPALKLVRPLTPRPPLPSPGSIPPPLSPVPGERGHHPGEGEKE